MGVNGQKACSGIFAPIQPPHEGVPHHHKGKTQHRGKKGRWTLKKKRRKRKK